MPGKVPSPWHQLITYSDGQRMWTHVEHRRPNRAIVVSFLLEISFKAIKAPTATILSDIDGKQERWSVGDRRWPSPHRNPVNTCCFTISAWRTLLPCYPWTLYHGAVPTVTVFNIFFWYCLLKHKISMRKDLQVEHPDHLEAWVEALQQGDLQLETARQVIGCWL